MEAGELLGQRDFTNELEQALVLEAEADATLSRLQKAYEKRAVSRQDLDEATSRARIAAAEIKIKQKALEDSSIRAPMAGVSRLRPVSMAAATTVLGMAPLLGDIFFVSMSLAVMFGLTFATVLTLIVVPTLVATLYGLKPPR